MIIFDNWMLWPKMLRILKFYTAVQRQAFWKMTRPLDSITLRWGGGRQEILDNVDTIHANTLNLPQTKMIIVWQVNVMAQNATDPQILHWGATTSLPENDKTTVRYNFQMGGGGQTGSSYFENLASRCCSRYSFGEKACSQTRILALWLIAVHSSVSTMCSLSMLKKKRKKKKKKKSKRTIHRVIYLIARRLKYKDDISCWREKQMFLDAKLIFFFFSFVRHHINQHSVLITKVNIHWKTRHMYMLYLKKWECSKWPLSTPPAHHLPVQRVYRIQSLLFSCCQYNNVWSGTSTNQLI